MYHVIMLDTLFFVIIMNINWLYFFQYIALSGFPLLFSIFYVFWSLHIFPSSMYEYSYLNISHLLQLLIYIDILQALFHWSSHTFLKKTFIGKSHMKHHIHRNPKPQDAFYTGFFDAIFQLIVPLMITLHIVQPCRITATLFGAIYSWWLNFIHSSPSITYSYLENFCIVTPYHHYRHHQDPQTNFSNIIDINKILVHINEMFCHLCQYEHTLHLNCVKS